MGISGISRYFFFVKTIPHVMTKTTPVRIAVPKLDSTFSIPIFANIEVSAAKTAERIAYMSQVQEVGSVFVPLFFWIIRIVPVNIEAMQISFKSK